ncbi:MAG: transglycosylase SLT domain-containing protein [Thiothrix sp.]
MNQVINTIGRLALLCSLLGVVPSTFAAKKVDCPIIKDRAIQQAVAPFQVAINAAANRYDVSPKLIQAVIHVRSCFDALHLSQDGEIGLMQLMPLTARGFGATNTFDPAENIDAGTRYLSYLLKRYEGNIATAVTAFVADEGWSWQQEVINTPFASVRSEVTRILEMFNHLAPDKQTYKQAQATLKALAKSNDAYREALMAIPLPPAQKQHLAWYKSRLQKVHYPRPVEERNCAGLSRKALEAKAAVYEDLIQQAAKRHGVSSGLIKSVIAAESCYREMVVSPKGAAGLMQLMPETAEELGIFDIFDPAENINAGTRYLAWLIRRYNGSYTHAIAAYNAGPGRIEPNAPITISFAETRGYIRSVLTGLTRLEKNKQAIANAETLLAEWEQAELEYSETTTLPDGIPADMHRVGLALPVAAGPTEFASAQVLPAMNQGIVRVKKVLPGKPEAVQPENSTAIASETLLTAQPVTPAMENVTFPTEPVESAPLADCNTLPASTRAQTTLRGSGHYSAVFYSVKPGETLERIAQKLDMDLNTMQFMTGLAPDARPLAGHALKIAECIGSP